MTVTYDLSTLIGKVRLYSKDTSLISPRFTDEEILVFLEMEGNDPRLAAAVNLENTAASQTLMAKVVGVGDIKLDGISLAESLISQANHLRRLVRISKTGSSSMGPISRGKEKYPLI